MTKRDTRCFRCNVDKHQMLVVKSAQVLLLDITEFSQKFILFEKRPFHRGLFVIEYIHGIIFKSMPIAGWRWADQIQRGEKYVTDHCSNRR